MIYVNGDSHSAGAELVGPEEGRHCFAGDDPNYRAYGRDPHPEAVPKTFGYKLAQHLGEELVLDAESASSNDRILRTTQEYLREVTPTLVVIGWATWEREEWNINGEYYQLTAGGTDSVPEHMENEYKSWVLNQTERTLEHKCNIWHDRIWQLHTELQDRNIPHLFFNTYMQFNDNNRRDWGTSYIDPYEMMGTYYYWLEDKGYQTVTPDSYHYGEDAHTAWYKYLLDRYINA